MTDKLTKDSFCPTFVRHSPEKVRPFSFPAGHSAADAIAMAKPRRDSSSTATKRRGPADGGVKTSSTGKFKSRKRAPLGENRDKSKKKVERQANEAGPDEQGPRASSMAPAEALSFFLDQFETANGIKLSSLELEAFKGPVFTLLSVPFIVWIIAVKCYSLRSMSVLYAPFFFFLNLAQTSSCLLPKSIHGHVTNKK